MSCKRILFLSSTSFRMQGRDSSPTILAALNRLSPLMILKMSSCSLYSTAEGSMISPNSRMDSARHSREPWSKFFLGRSGSGLIRWMLMNLASLRGAVSFLSPFLNSLPSSYTGFRKAELASALFK